VAATRRRIDELRDLIKLASIPELTYQVTGLQQEREPLFRGLGFPAGVLHPLKQRGSFLLPALVGGEVNDKRHSEEWVEADRG